MNQGPLVFLGVFLAMAVSWSALILEPQRQLGNGQPATAVSTGDPYPQKRSGQANQGAEVYRSLGCVSCHSQQIAWPGYNSDIRRGWGNRRSVAPDYLYDQTVLLGSQRVGPDLSNIGLRSPGAESLLLHLYNPQATLPKGTKSIMPPYRFLFQTQKIRSRPSPDALVLPSDFAPPPGYEVVPTGRAKALVAYLLSLRSDPILFETPMPQAATNSPSGSASSSANTNAPAK